MEARVPSQVPCPRCAQWPTLSRRRRHKAVTVDSEISCGENRGATTSIYRQQVREVTAQQGRGIRVVRAQQGRKVRGRVLIRNYISVYGPAMHQLSIPLMCCSCINA
jgi:hypothetical protein